MIKETILTTLILTASPTKVESFSLRTFFGFKPKVEHLEKYRARVTYYTVGEDKWGDRVADPKTHRAKQGTTVAHHPKYSFGTSIRIPQLEGVVGDGNFKVQDRGSAVTKKRASRGRTYVIDVFVKNKRTMRKLMHSQPMYMDVYVMKSEKAAKK